MKDFLAIMTLPLSMFSIFLVLIILVNVLGPIGLLIWIALMWMWLKYGGK